MFVLHTSDLLKQFLRRNHSFNQLQNILSKMKVTEELKYPRDIGKFGNSHMFQYAIYKDSDLQGQTLTTWSKFVATDIGHLSKRVPLNGFEEIISLTEEGKLWPYPIDNELGLEEEKQVPFEDHVFLDKHLEDFPENEYIRTFMQLVIMGLGKNPHMTVERKRKVIKFFKDYFESKQDVYKQGGFDM